MRTALVATALLLAGCSAAPQAAPTSTTTHTASAADIGYLAKVRPAIQGSSDADLISLGKQACDQLDRVKVDNDAAVLDTAQALIDKGISTAGAAAIVTAAIPAYCPQYKAALPTP